MFYTYFSNMKTEIELRKELESLEVQLSGYHEESTHSMTEVQLSRHKRAIFRTQTHINSLKWALGISDRKASSDPRDMSLAQLKAEILRYKIEPSKNFTLNELRRLSLAVEGAMSRYPSDNWPVIDAALRLNFLTGLLHVVMLIPDES